VRRYARASNTTSKPMPIVTVTIRKPKSSAFKAQLLGAIHAALVDIGVDPNDRFHRVLELDEENFQYDPSFPDVKTRRTGDFVLVEILLGAGREVSQKKKVLASITEQLSSHGFDTENLMVVFQDIPFENFSPAGGRSPYAS
jgi:phenylpyruvate tautomerase PptA (4-oxalocrotonate tautomerase family)